jgi:hypothetical protein
MNMIRDESRLSDGEAHVIRNTNSAGGRIYGPKHAAQDTSSPERIVTQSYDFLERNLITGTHQEYGFQYSFSMPSSYKYGPSQWLWGMTLSDEVDGRFRGSSDFMGKEECRSGHCRFEGNVEFSIV